MACRALHLVVDAFLQGSGHVLMHALLVFVVSVFDGAIVWPSSGWLPMACLNSHHQPSYENDVTLLIRRDRYIPLVTGS